MDFDTILIAGPQGSGKGTQSELLAKKTGFLYLSMGGMLREVLAENKNAALVEKVSVINQGTLLTDDVVIEVIKEKLESLASDQGVIFEGIPRRIGQADFVLNFTKEQSRKLPVTIFINIPREVSVQRLLLRAKKEGRVDDTPEGIDTRLKYYEDVIKPTMDYLKTRTRFFEIDGTPSIETVEKSINAALGI
jgi:adenylate kinase